jgi:hypothetical protein
MDPGVEILLRLQSYWIHGVIGGMLRELLNGGGLKLPAWDAKCRTLKLGILGSILFGVAAAALVDGGIATALPAAIAGPFVVEKLIERVADTFAKSPEEPVK